MKQDLISWAPYIVFIGLWVLFMVSQGKHAQNQNKQMEDYINESLKQLERLTVAIEKIADKMEKKD